MSEKIITAQEAFEQVTSNKKEQERLHREYGKRIWFEFIQPKIQEAVKELQYCCDLELPPKERDQLEFSHIAQFGHSYGFMVSDEQLGCGILIISWGHCKENDNLGPL